MTCIIFLDVDGVLNNQDILVESTKGNIRSNFIVHKEFPNVVMDKHRLDVIVNLAKEYDAKIVISSSWRILFMDHLREILLPHDILHDDAATDQLNSRGEEIQDWLNRHKEVTDYIIIDDDIGDMLDEQLGHCIKTTFTAGLTDVDVRVLRKLLHTARVNATAQVSNA